MLRLRVKTLSFSCGPWLSCDIHGTLHGFYFLLAVFRNIRAHIAQLPTQFKSWLQAGTKSQRNRSMKMNIQTHKPFRSRREREQEVDLVKKYRGIGIAAVAAAGSRTDAMAAPVRKPAPATVEAVD